MADILGYARVSTDTQELDSQRARLKEAGAIKIFECYKRQDFQKTRS